MVVVVAAADAYHSRPQIYVDGRRELAVWTFQGQGRPHGQPQRQPDSQLVTEIQQRARMRPKQLDEPPKGPHHYNSSLIKHLTREKLRVFRWPFWSTRARAQTRPETLGRQENAQNDS